MTHTEHTVEMAILLVLLASAVAIAARFIRIPYTVTLVLVGLGVAFVPGLPAFSLSADVVFYVILPPILLQAGLNLDFSQLHRNLKAIAFLAVPGIVISTLATAAVLHLLSGLAFRYCLVFGALIAPTDPISVLAIFKEMRVPERLRVLVEGESLFNDGTGVILFRSLLALAVAGAGGGGGHEVGLGAAAVGFLVAFVGGGAVGLGLGLTAYHVLKRLDDHALETMITVVLTYGAFVLAERLHLGPHHLSGVIACVVAALFLGNYGREFSMSPRTNEAITTFWESIDFILNSILFLLMGLEIQVIHLETTIFTFTVPILAALAANLVGRAVSVYPLMLVVHRFWADVTPSWSHVVFWGGLKGSIPLALALQLRGRIPSEVYSVLISATFAVVLMSLTVQALTMKPLLVRLKVSA